MSSEQKLAAFIFGLLTLLLVGLAGNELFNQRQANVEDANDVQSAAVADNGSETVAGDGDAAPAGDQEPAVSQEETPAETAGLGPSPRIPDYDVIRVEPNGEAVFAGTGEPGWRIELRVEGEAIGAAVVDAGGEWVIVTDKPLTAGPSDVTLHAVSPEGAMTVNAPNTVTVAIDERKEETPLVMLTDPDAPSDVIQQPLAEQETAPAAAPDGQTQDVAAAPQATAPQTDDNAAAAAEEGGEPVSRTPQDTAAGTAETAVVIEGDGPTPDQTIAIETVEADSKGQLFVTGKGEPGSTVRVYAGNEPVGEVVVGNNGEWKLSAEKSLAEGSHAIRADDLGGETAERPIARAEGIFERPDPNLPVVAFAELPAERARPGEATEHRLVVRKGDNLWNIAREVYGRGVRFSVIYEANTGQIRDPDLIYPGQVFAVPRNPRLLETEPLSN